MTPEEINKIKTKIERAEELIETLKVLREAKRECRGNERVSWQPWSTTEEIIKSDDLLRCVIVAGVDAMIRRFEDELSAMNFCGEVEGE
jgi:hypothetical protein